MAVGARVRACALAAAIAAGCAHAPPHAEGLAEKLKATPGAFVSGQPVGLERIAVLDNKDFGYAIAVSPASDAVAFTRLFGRKFNLWAGPLARGDAPKPWADVATNDYEFDVEAVAFSPEGAWVVTAGRDGVVRAFDPRTGALKGQIPLEEPAVSLAFVGEGALAVGGARGTITLLAWPELRFLSEARAHEGEVRGLAAASADRLVSGGWDKSVAVFRVEEGSVDAARVRLSLDTLRTPAKTRALLAALDGRAAPFAFDAASPHVYVHSDLARAAGIEPAALTRTVHVEGALRKVAPGRALQLKHSQVEVEVVVCDECVPAGTRGVLGKPVLDAARTWGVEGDGLVIEWREAAAAAKTQVLREEKRHAFDAYVNDLSIDAAGERIGVALSAEKAERNREVYLREKRGEPAREDARDRAAIVEVETGAVVAEWRAHRGVVSTVGISPDGRTVASGGWDNRLVLATEGAAQEVAVEEFGWILRRVRFAPNGVYVAVAAWTPANAVGSLESDPATVLYEALYSAKLGTGYFLRNPD